ncbi:uncharacterized protein LOC117282516 isoform X2 [Cryptotermes secundus]|uniref:uncharacterized protein LOC117282516 isoform X2 n=1 Tax=Cryptotermes secundus TaxID=105785 RepID=UPI001454C668|nr:uncharacterized protein LOC117282516 isoform X2 [Cryptotermes secundus]
MPIRGHNTKGLILTATTATSDTITTETKNKKKYCAIVSAEELKKIMENSEVAICGQELLDMKEDILTCGAEPFWRSRQFCSYSRISQHFMEPEVEYAIKQIDYQSTMTPPAQYQEVLHTTHITQTNIWHSS